MNDADGDQRISSRALARAIGIDALHLLALTVAIGIALFLLWVLPFPGTYIGGVFWAWFIPLRHFPAPWINHILHLSALLAGIYLFGRPRGPKGLGHLGRTTSKVGPPLARWFRLTYRAAVGLSLVFAFFLVNELIFCHWDACFLYALRYF